MLQPVGIVRSPFKKPEGTPIQPVYAEGATGEVEVFPAYIDGLAGLTGFERIWLVYHMHCVNRIQLKVAPYRGEEEQGVFATRAPCRPNPIGLSCVRLVAVEGNMLRIAEVDVLDGTPVWDIKPYIPAFDAFSGVKAGWMDASRSERPRTGDRAHA